MAVTFRVPQHRCQIANALDMDKGLKRSNCYGVIFHTPSIPIYWDTIEFENIPSY
jgi:hypothetical protein